MMKEEIINRQLQRTYSEVYSLLQMLGDGFIDKLPTHLYRLLQEEKLEEYNPTYSLDLALEEQNIKKEALSMIGLFHLTFWCNSEEEREELNDLFKKAQANKQESAFYNPIKAIENNSGILIKEESNQKDTQMIKRKESLFSKILQTVKSLFVRQKH